MIKWIRRLLGLCEHEWKDVSVVKLYQYPDTTLPVGQEIVQKCELCAKYRKQALS